MALKILLADDSMTAQNMGKKILADAGYDVVAVSNGAAAIKKIASDRPDIIILDVYMPGYTGLEVCERVKAASETARTPVLLTVGKMEPFKPEEANRVKADGVMIKPFEATDLVAAIQSFATKLQGGMPAASHKSADTTLRIPPPPAPGADTFRIPPPPTAHELEDTVPVAQPFDQEATVRLTPEQVKAFQDATYKDWMASTDEHLGVAQASANEAVSDVSLTEPALETLEVKQEVPMLEGGPEAPASLIVSAESSKADESLIARAMGNHEIFTVERQASASPLVAELPEHNDIPFNTSVIYQPTESLVVSTESSEQPFFALEPALEPIVEHVEPVLAQVETVAVAPEAVIAEPSAVASVIAPELETSAPVELLAIPIPQLEELEPTIAPPMEVVAATAPDLEINSPIHLQPNVVVEADPALITNDDGGMSQFVNKFGAEHSEEIAVGLVSDLSPEHLSAVTMPMAVGENPMESAGAAVEVAPTSVMDEVGEIETPSTGMTQEVVAYVPGFNDTQRFVPAAIMPDESGKIEQVETPGVPEPAVAEVDQGPVTATEEPGIVSAVATEAVPAELTPIAEDGPAMPTMGVVAAVAGVSTSAVAAYGMSHYDAVMGPAPEAAVDFEAPAEIVAEPVVEDTTPGPVGDAALAEELAAALSSTETELPTHEATEAAVATAMEPAVAAAIESVAGMEEAHSWSDAKLSAAVAKAIEHLKPQLISEILKELTK